MEEKPSGFQKQLLNSEGSLLQHELREGGSRCVWGMQSQARALWLAHGECAQGRAPPGRAKDQLRPN